MNEQDQFSFIPTGEVFRAANELAAKGLIENRALGGALTGVYYTESEIDHERLNAVLKWHILALPKL